MVKIILTKGATETGRGKGGVLAAELNESVMQRPYGYSTKVDAGSSDQVIESVFDGCTVKKSGKDYIVS